MSKPRKSPNRTATRRPAGALVPRSEWLPVLADAEQVGRERMFLDYTMQNLARELGPRLTAMVDQVAAAAVAVSESQKLLRARDAILEARAARDAAEERAAGSRLARLDDNRKRSAGTHPEWYAPEIVQRISMHVDRIEAAHQVLDSLVSDARAQGIPWADIGAVTGRGAEGARSRWGRRQGTA